VCPGRRRIESPESRSRRISFHPKTKKPRQPNAAKKKGGRLAGALPFLVILACVMVNVIVNRVSVYQSNHSTPSIIEETDEDGVVERHYSDDGTLIYQSETKDDGSVVEWYYDSDGNPSSSYSYDEDGVLTFSEYYNDDGSAFSQDYYEDGILTYSVDYYDDGSREELYYTEDGDILSLFYYDEDGQPIESYEYEYDDLGRRTKTESYNGTGELVSIEEQIYDENGKGSVVLTETADGVAYETYYYDEDDTLIGWERYDEDTHELLSAWGKDYDGNPCGQ
jgi:hypothetical protein